MGFELTSDKEKRNELCSCESGLKFKKCHGDPRKIGVVQHIANEAMIIMIAYEKRKRDELSDEEYEETINNPDFVIQRFYEQFILGDLS